MRFHDALRRKIQVNAESYSFVFVAMEVRGWGNASKTSSAMKFLLVKVDFS
jgi:hypothetical protein